MSQLFFQVPNFTTAAQTPKVSNIVDLYDSNFEYDAYAHWIFDQANDSVLTDRLNNKKLTHQGSAPTFTADGVVRSNLSGQALLSDFYSSAENSFTLAAYMKASTVAGAVIACFGDLALSSVTDESAFSGYIANAKFVAGSRIVGTAQNLTSADPTLVADTFFAVSLSVDKSKNIVSLGILKDANGFEFTKTITGPYTASTFPIALGNARFSSGNTTSNLTFAEFSIFNHAKSVSELSRLNQRMKKRANERGLT